MAIQNMSRSSFEVLLSEYLSPTTPIRSPEFLRGRGANLETIRRALIHPGRQIFIYGDRGVGKTSLAQTAAFEHQSSDMEPVLLSCGAPFFQIIRDLAEKCLRFDPSTIKQMKQNKASINLSGLSVEMAQSIEKGRVPEIHSINQAIEITKFAAKQHSQVPVIVLDEFERVRIDSDKELFSDYIKQLGDQSIDVRIIFCGVADSLDNLLMSHHSCFRYLTTVKLDRLGWDGRFEIIQGVAAALQLLVDETTMTRIGSISDGYPYYIHLICEQLFWGVFEDKDTINTTKVMHYTEAIKHAVKNIEPQLKRKYDSATKKYKTDYEEILWAVADNPELQRRSADIFRSYLRIMEARGKPLERDKFNARMNALKQKSHGSILRATRQGWYEFSENILRGYVRLRAEECGAKLDIQHPLEARIP